MNVTSKIGHTVTVSAVVIRADGTREDLGIIGQSKKQNNFIKWVKGLVKKNG